MLTPVDPELQGDLAAKSMSCRRSSEGFRPNHRQVREPVAVLFARVVELGLEIGNQLEFGVSERR